MGYDANEDTYATSCDEFSDSESELSSVEMLFKGYEPSLVVLDGSDHALFGQIDQLIDCLRAAKLIQQVRVSTAFLQGLDVVDEEPEPEADTEAAATTTTTTTTTTRYTNKASPEAHALFAAIAGLAPICETFICHMHRHLPRAALQQEGGGLLQCTSSLSRLTLNNFLLTDALIASLGANPELVELRAYFDSKQQDGQAVPLTDGLDPLFLALAQSPRLQILDVYAKEDERPEKPRRVTASALTALCHHPALKEWKLWHLDTDLITAVAQALSATTNGDESSNTTTKLEKLSLNTCFVQTKGYCALADMLRVNTTLTHLHISDIVSAEACLALAAGLADNRTLQELELTYESDSDKVGRAMVNMLETNTTLRQLKLYMSYSFENDMSFSAEKGTEYEEAQAQQDDWEARIDELLQQNREGTR